LYIRAEGTFDDIMYITDTWGPFTVFNPRTPIMTWIYPVGDEDPLKDVYFHIELDELDGDVEMFDIWYSFEGGDWAYLDDHMDEYADNIGWVPEDEFLTSFDWGPFQLPDGDYSFKANLTTSYGVYAESVIGPITVDFDHPPSITYVAPPVDSTLDGSVGLEVDYHDVDDNIGSSGVEFLYRREGGVAFVMIGGDADGDGSTYSLIWDTTAVLNGNYTLRAEAADLSDPPKRGGVEWDVEVWNTFEPSGLFVPDLSSDEVTLRIGFPDRPVGLPITLSVSMGLPGDIREQGEFTFDAFSSTSPDKYVEMVLSLGGFPEGNMTVEVTVIDAFGMEGSIERVDLFYHHPVQSPVVEVLSLDEMVVKGNVSLRARVLDDDVPLIDMPSFYYSKDNSSWELIGKGILVDLKVYEVTWDTGLVENWTDYHIKVEYLDSDSLLGVGHLGGIEVRNPPPPLPPVEEEEQMWYEESSNIIKLSAAALLIGSIAGILIAVSLRSSKRRKRIKDARFKKEEERRLGTAGIKSRREMELTKKQSGESQAIPAPRPRMEGGTGQGVAVGGAGVSTQKPTLTEYEVPEDESAPPEYTLPDS
ncbi:MAG: hypothetical protein KAH57_11125, partial [Thermoplasmata archaeon]|nr:hypothetical protein [Thermoplasmata archaeon]